MFANKFNKIDVSIMLSNFIVLWNFGGKIDFDQADEYDYFTHMIDFFDIL